MEEYLRQRKRSVSMHLHMKINLQNTDAELWNRYLNPTVETVLTQLTVSHESEEDLLPSSLLPMITLLQ